MMKYMINNKKANMWGIQLRPVIFIFLFGLLTFVGFAMYSQFYMGYEDSGLISSTGTDVFEKMGAGILLLDWIALIVVVALIIGATWVLSKQEHNPVEFVAAWVMLAFVGFAGYVFSYGFGQFFTIGIIYEISLYFPKISVLGTNGHWIAFGSFIISQLFLYSKKRKQGDLSNEPI